MELKALNQHHLRFCDLLCFSFHVYFYDLGLVELSLA